MNRHQSRLPVLGHCGPSRHCTSGSVPTKLLQLTRISSHGTENEEPPLWADRVQHQRDAGKHLVALGVSRKHHQIQQAREGFGRLA